MPVITKIVNLSIETGEMPNDFKHAVIISKRNVKGLFTKTFALYLDYPSCPKSLTRLLTQPVTASNLNEQYWSAYRR